jgi:ribosomal protein S18 acetylase RimI-like enzyme
MGFHIVRDIDEEKLVKLLCGDGGFDSIYDIYEAGAPDLLQMAAVEDLSGDYAGFISCTVLGNTEFADFSESEKADSSLLEAGASTSESDYEADNSLLEAYVATNFRRKGVFTLMFEAMENELAKVCVGNVPAIITSMDDDTFEMLKNSRLRPTLQSTEYLYGIDREHYEERHENFGAHHENNQSNYGVLKECAESNNSLKMHLGDYHYAVTEEADDRLCFQAIGSEDFIIGELFLDLSENSACINDVWVDEDCRKKGVATALVSHALNSYFSSKDTADNTVILHVTGSNTAAVKLYKKCGFFEIECVKYYSLPYLL